MKKKASDIIIIKKTGMNHHLYNYKLSCINSKTWRKFSLEFIYVPENKK